MIRRHANDPKVFISESTFMIIRVEVECFGRLWKHVGVWDFFPFQNLRQFND
jgi:hypothetical protein